MYYVRVDSEQSRRLQELAFANGKKWAGGEAIVKYTDRLVLALTKKKEIVCNTDRHMSVREWVDMLAEPHMQNTVFKEVSVREFERVLRDEKADDSLLADVSKSICIQVTPQESEELQRYAFSRGIYWPKQCSFHKEVIKTSGFLFIEFSRRYNIRPELRRANAYGSSPTVSYEEFKRACDLRGKSPQGRAKVCQHKVSDIQPYDRVTIGSNTQFAVVDTNADYVYLKKLDGTYMPPALLSECTKVPLDKWA